MILQPANDTQLLARIARRDEAALAALYDCYAPLIMGAVVRITDDVTVAEAVVGETFWWVWRVMDNDHGPHIPVRQWLLCLALTLTQQRLAGYWQDTSGAIAHHDK